MGIINTVTMMLNQVLEIILKLIVFDKIMEISHEILEYNARRKWRFAWVVDNRQTPSIQMALGLTSILHTALMWMGLVYSALEHIFSCRITQRLKNVRYHFKNCESANWVEDMRVCQKAKSQCMKFFFTKHLWSTCSTWTDLYDSRLYQTRCLHAGSHGVYTGEAWVHGVWVFSALA